MENDFTEKKVDQVLDPYDLLDVSVIQDRHQISMHGAMPWRMNLCAASQRTPCMFFIAFDCEVHVYRLDTIRAAFSRHIKRLTSPNMARLGAGFESSHVINAIKLGRMLDKEILVTVAENGEICIWDTGALAKPPMILNNDATSTWGIALHAEQGLLAVSANHWKITVYNFLVLKQQHDSLWDGKPSQERPVRNVLQERRSIQLEGHTNNVPNIDFSACGRYIASCSIDQTCRIWDLERRDTIRQFKTGNRDRSSDGWGWSVKFMRLGAFKWTRCKDPVVDQAIKRRIEQRRACSLPSIDLRHSAILPIYRINYPNLESDGVDSDFDDSSFHYEYSLADWDPEMLQGEMENGYPVATNSTATSSQVDSLEDSEPAGISSSAGDDNEEDTSMSESVALDEGQGTPEHHSHNDVQGSTAHDAPGEETNQVNSRAIETIVDEVLMRADDINYDAEYPYQHHPHSQNRSPMVPIDTNPTERLGQAALTIPPLVDGGWDDPIVLGAPIIIEDDNVQGVNDGDVPCQGETRHDLIPQVMKSSSDILVDPHERATMDEYLMLTTKTDLYLLSTRKRRMTLVREEHNVVSDVDVRSDGMLQMTDRLNMVEWVPELELLIVGSQKGTVALTRVLQVTLENGQQTCLMNKEYYLPLNGLLYSGLYGMTVRKADVDRMAGPIYHLYLFYYAGHILAYRIGRSRNAELEIDALCT